MRPLVPLPSLEERRKLRDAMGLTLPEAAAQLHVSPRTLLRWEWGDSYPSPVNHRNYAELLESWRVMLGW